MRRASAEGSATLAIDNLARGLHALQDEQGLKLNTAVRDNGLASSSRSSALPYTAVADRIARAAIR
jgi:hypothetical protein